MIINARKGQPSMRSGDHILHEKYVTAMNNIQT